MTPVTINQRWTLLLPEHRDRGEWWDNWEKERLASMSDQLTPLLGEVVYYAGAEQGDMPALLTSWGCDTVLVEPVARVWPNMRAIYEANNLKDPLACFVGFAGAADRGNPGIDEGWPPEASGDVTDVEGFANLWERDDLPIIALDSLPDAGIDPPSAISIDVEGSELEVLRGATGCLLLHRPLVWVSIHPTFMADLYDQHPDEIFSLMARHGYRGRMLADLHESHWLFWPEEYPR